MSLILLTIVSCPDPLPFHEEKGLVTFECVLGCAESAVLIFELSEGGLHHYDIICYFIGLFKTETAESAQPRKHSVDTRPLVS